MRGHPSFVPVGVAVVALAAGGMVVAPGAYAAGTPACSASSCTVSYDVTGAPVEFVVPVGVSQLVATVSGGSGGEGHPAAIRNRGGAGGSVTTLVPVTAGEALTVVVGGKGPDGVSSGSGTIPGGYGGGGQAWVVGGGSGGGGGGGSFLFAGSGVLVAAGGGGGGGWTTSGNGGAGGAGGDGASGGSTTNNGRGGTTTAPGMPGGGGSAGTGPASGPTTFGFGGSAGTGCAYCGSGGGGYYGGGSGGPVGYNNEAGNGGGGSGVLAAGVTALSRGTHVGDGSVTLTWAVPGAPAGVSATPGDQQASLSWTAPSTTATVTGYVVTATDTTTGDGTSVVCPGSTSSTATSCTATGLSNGHSYTFTVIATTSSGTGVASAMSAAVVPTAPVAVSVTGTQTYGGQPAFSPSATVPTGLSLNGTVTCSTVNGGEALAPSLPARGSYTIDGSSCSGLSLSGSDASAYSVSYAGGAFTVDQVLTTTTLDSMEGVVFGQPTTFSAVESPATPGSISFAVDGTDLGSSAVDSTGVATSRSVSDLAVGNHDVEATFTPADANYSTSVSATRTLVVGKADTRVSEPTVSLDSVSVTVSPVAPGAGQPGGTVTFYADGTQIGTAAVGPDGAARLAYSHRGAATIAVSYLGDGSFNASSSSTAVSNPTVTASVASRRPKTSDGWYGAPVTVTFHCTAGSAPLTAPCPAPVVVDRSAAAQSASATVLATDGGIATVNVSPINVDLQAPSLRVRGVRSGATYNGTIPSISCTAATGPSGLTPAGCRVRTTRSGTRVTYTAVATSKAGISSRVRGHVRVRPVFIAGVTPRHGVYRLKMGRVYSLRAYSTHKAPVFIYAAPRGTRPGPGHASMSPLGRGLWQIRIALNRTPRKTWEMAVAIGKKHHRITVRLR
jgi:hypothetical protein